MTTHNYQQQNLKKKQTKNELSKQLAQEQIQRNRDHLEGYQCGGVGGEWGKGTGNKKYKWKAKYRQRETLRIVWEMAKELKCTTHGHELRWGNDGGREGTG